MSSQSNIGHVLIIKEEGDGGGFDMGSGDQETYLEPVEPPVRGDTKSEEELLGSDPGEQGVVGIM
jgi:hypothetical protein